MNVAVDVERLKEETMVINKNMINIENAMRLTDFIPELTDTGIEYLKYDILDNSVELVLKGREQDLAILLPSMLTPHIDVDGLGEGIYSLPLLVNERNNIQAIELPLVNVEITKITLPAMNNGEPENEEETDEPAEGDLPEDSEDIPVDEEIL